MYKKAAKAKLRFVTSKGTVSVEQLFDMNLAGLKNLLIEINSALTPTSSLDFLESTPVDSIMQLRFDIVKDIYLTKIAENEERKTKLANDEHNQRIMSIIAEKQAEQERNLSIDELKSMLK